MDIVFTKLSSEEHAVQVCREDDSVERVLLNSRSFLRHDLAHLAVEMELPLSSGYWGSVASGAALAGSEIKGKEIGIAEALAGPVQTLMRVEAKVDQYAIILKRVQPQLASLDLASRIHERARKLQGHWRATEYGAAMCVKWLQ